MKDGGPAFPTSAVHQGMSLRDYFAGQALAGFLGADVEGVVESTQAAKFAYETADAMLAEREKTNARSR